MSHRSGRIFGTLVLAMAERGRAGRKTGAHSQAARTFSLLDELSVRQAPTPLHTLAEKLEVSVRQLRRDLKLLETSGNALDLSILDGRSAVRLTRSKGAEPLTLGIRERFSFLLVERVFGAMQGTPFAVDVARVLGRLTKTPTLKDERAKWAKRMTYIADGGVKPYDRKRSAVLNELLSGLMYTQRVEVVYRTASGQRKQGRFEPRGLAIYRHGVYLVGKLAGGAHPNYVLPLERFVSAKRHRERFEVEPDFDVSKVFHDAIGIVVGGEPTDVVLEMSPQVAHLLEVRRFHHSQKTTRLPGGGMRVTMRVANTPDLLSSILAWGEHVQVVEPEALREQVRATLEKALAAMKDSKGER